MDNYVVGLQRFYILDLSVYLFDMFLLVSYCFIVVYSKEGVL